MNEDNIIQAIAMNLRENIEDMSVTGSYIVASCVMDEISPILEDYEGHSLDIYREDLNNILRNVGIQYPTGLGGVRVLGVDCVNKQQIIDELNAKVERIIQENDELHVTIDRMHDWSMWRDIETREDFLAAIEDTEDHEEK